jgi:hypothetical protein
MRPYRHYDYGLTRPAKCLQALVRGSVITGVEPASAQPCLSPTSRIAYYPVTELGDVPLTATYKLSADLHAVIHPTINFRSG